MANDGRNEDRLGNQSRREGEARREVSPFPRSAGEVGEAPDSGPAPGAPHWLSVVGLIIAIVVVLLVVILHLSGAVGPGAHTP